LRSTSLRTVRETVEAVRKEVKKVVVGEDELIDGLITSLLCGEHVLIEGPPGSAKTLAAKAFALSIGATFKRVQMTVETMPADIVGFYAYTLTGDRRFVKGPVFSNILLVDELNRAPPRTQSALLEAMQERQVTIEGDSYELPYPFVVVATQVPYGAVGTYALPEVLVDRFAIRIKSRYVEPELEVEVLSRTDLIELLPIERVVTLGEIIDLISAVKRVKVDRDVASYMVNIVNYLRGHEAVESGPSIRASVHLYKASRARAAMEGRDYVIPDDVKRVAALVLEHRFRIKTRAEMRGLSPEDLVEEALESVPVPK